MKRKRLLTAALWATTIALFFAIASGFTSSKVRLKSSGEDDSTTASQEESTTQLESSTQQDSSSAETQITESTIKDTPASSTSTTKKTVVTTTEKTTKKQTSTTTVKVETTRAGENRPVPAAATEKSFTVTFNSGGGTAVSSQTVADGGLVVKPVDPKRQGFKFEGWHKDAALKQPLDFKKDRVAANVTVYAKWSTLAGTITHKITYKEGAGGYVAPTPPEAVGGESVLLIVYPDKGKRIKPGTLTVNGNPIEGLSFKMPEKDVIVSCDFEDAPVTQQEGTRINKKFAGIGVVAILSVITLIVLGIVLGGRQKYVDEPEWTDESVILSDYQKNENKYGKNQSEHSDNQND